MRLLQRRRPKPVPPSARRFLTGAIDESRRLGHDYVGTEHLLLALAEDESRPGAAVLAQLGVSADDVRADILALIGPGVERRGRIDRDALAALGIDFDEVRRRIEDAFGEGALERTSGACTPVCPRLKRALQAASERAGGHAVRDEDVLVGLVSVPDSMAATILRRRGVSGDAVRAAVAA